MTNWTSKQTKLEASVHKKPMNIRLLLYFDSHDQGWQKGPSTNYAKQGLQTVIELRTPQWWMWGTEVDFVKLTTFVTDKVPSDATDKSNDTLAMVMFSLPFIDQKTKEHTRRQLQNLSSKIRVSLHPVFSSKKGGNIFRKQLHCMQMTVKHLEW